MFFVYYSILMISGLIKSLKYISLTKEDDNDYEDVNQCDEVFRSSFLVMMVFISLSIDWRI